MKTPAAKTAKKRNLLQRALAFGRVFRYKGKLCRWLKVGEIIDDDDYYWDGKCFGPTTNAGNEVNHRRSYMHPLKYQRPCGCVDWRCALTS